MRECLHVFRKDVRHFWPYIAALLAIRMAWLYLFPDRMIGSALVGMPAVFLPPLAGFFLVAAVIHEDGPCGDDQFWLTRPHRPLNLLAAKMLFALVFLNLPYFVSDLIWSGQAGVLSSAAVEAAAWRQVMLAGWFVLVPAAAAAITRTVTQYVFCCAGAVFVAAVLPDAVAGMQTVWGPLQWLRGEADLAIFSAAALAALVWQYRRRNAAVSRGIFAAGFGAVLGLATFAPWGAAHALQARMTGATAVPAVNIEFDAGREAGARAALGRGAGRSIAVEIPVKVTGGRRAGDVFADALKLCVELDGSAPECTGWSASYWLHGQPSGEWARFTLERKFYDRLAARPATVRVLAALTLFTDRERAELAAGTGEWHLPGGTACKLGPDGMLACHSLDPSTRVLVETRGTAALFPLLGHFSYGPVADDLHIVPYPLRRNSSPYRVQGGDVVTTQRPAAHVIRQFETRVAGLGEFAVLEKQ